MKNKENKGKNSRLSTKLQISKFTDIFAICTDYTIKIKLDIQRFKLAAILAIKGFDNIINYGVSD